MVMNTVIKTIQRFSFLKMLDNPFRPSKWLNLPFKTDKELKELIDVLNKNQDNIK